MAASLQRIATDIWQWAPGRPGDACAAAERAEPSASAASNLPFDVAAVIELCVGQAAFAESLIHSFQQDSEAHLVKLRGHASQANSAAAANVAHALKGSAAIVSAGPVRRLAAEIQTAGEQGRTEEVRRLIEPLGQAIRHCRDYLPVVRDVARRVESQQRDEQNHESAGG